MCCSAFPALSTHVYCPLFLISSASSCVCWCCRCARLVSVWCGIKYSLFFFASVVCVVAILLFLRFSVSFCFCRFCVLQCGVAFTMCLVLPMAMNRPQKMGFPDPIYDRDQRRSWPPPSQHTAQPFRLTLGHLFLKHLLCAKQNEYVARPSISLNGSTTIGTIYARE